MRIAKHLTVFAKRDKMVQEWIQTEIEIYIDEKLGKGSTKKFRPCAYCGLHFLPKMRYHFFHRPVCRALYYRGQFRPRKIKR